MPPFDNGVSIGVRLRNKREADVPVLLSAMACRPDWLLTNNSKHFTKAVAQRTELRVATPAEFFRELAGLLR
jgi:hypothetical protein